MKLLEERIKKDGRVLSDDVLKVDSFLNHMLDVSLLNECAKEWKRIFENEHITKIVTIESSGIGIACITAQYFNVPVVYAKKLRTKNLGNDFYSTSVISYTHGQAYEVIISKDYISSDDSILLIDDFIANGSALNALITICEQAGANVVGAGIAVEKEYQNGANRLRERGYRIESLAKIKSMNKNGEIEFC